MRADAIRRPNERRAKFNAAKLDDALAQKAESVENVQKLLAEKAEMMMELGELKGIQSQIESQLNPSKAKAETIAKECETAEGGSE